MAELKDVVNELIEQTNKGELKWRKETNNWNVQCGTGSFVVGHDGLFLNYRPSNDYAFDLIGEGDAVRPLHDLLTKLLPPKSLTREEALEDALKCLTETGDG